MPCKISNNKFFKKRRSARVRQFQVSCSHQFQALISPLYSNGLRNKQRTRRTEVRIQLHMRVYAKMFHISILKACGKKRPCYILKCVFCSCGFYMINSKSINQKYEQKPASYKICLLHPSLTVKINFLVFLNTQSHDQSPVET